MDEVTAAVSASTLALKEWGAVARALLDGRQRILLRKGGIHEKAFALPGAPRFVLFPTVAHSHAERVRPEHQDLLARGAADVDEERGTFVVRCGVRLVAAVPVEAPEALAEIADLHIWTEASVRADRVDFRPRHALQALVVDPYELPAAVELPRLASYGGCTSWLELPVAWDGRSGRRVHDDAVLDATVERVRATVTAAA